MSTHKCYLKIEFTRLEIIMETELGRNRDRSTLYPKIKCCFTLPGFTQFQFWFCLPTRGLANDKLVQEYYENDSLDIFVLRSGKSIQVTQI